MDETTAVTPIDEEFSVPFEWTFPSKTLAEQKKNLFFNLVKMCRTIELDSDLEWQLSGDVKDSITIYEGIKGVASRRSDRSAYVSGEMLFNRIELSTAQLLAISVLADDDPRAAAALADYLQEQGIDAIDAARRQERKHVAAIFSDLAAWYEKYMSSSLASDYRDVAELIRDPRFDDAVRLNEELRLEEADRYQRGLNGTRIEFDAGHDARDGDVSEREMATERRSS